MRQSIAILIFTLISDLSGVQVLDYPGKARWTDYRAIAICMLFHWGNYGSGCLIPGVQVQIDRAG